MGAFICTISERDWEVSREKGVYGNRIYKEGTKNKLRDEQILSIIRDLISMKEGDIVFFHVRGRQTIHGVYEVRSEPFYEGSKIWKDKIEPFPFRFLFKRYHKYEYLAEHDAHIDVRSLYEYIDAGMVKSLVTLENEINIEARAVRRILKEDADVLIKLLHRDFKLKRSLSKYNFSPYVPGKPVPLKDMIFKVGRIENAIKAVIMYHLSHDLNFVNLLFQEEISAQDEVDFVNEFFIAQTTRKSVDIYCRYRNKHILIEVKTDKVDGNALKQVLYYRDLLLQRPWVHPQKDKIEIVLLGKRFSSDLLGEVKTLNNIGNGIKLIKYIPNENEKWGKFEYVD